MLWRNDKHTTQLINTQNLVNMKSLFFVDGDKSKTQLFSKKFSNGFNITSFNSGIACFQQIKRLIKLNEDLPEVIIIDYGLSDINGLKLQQKLQHLLEDTKIILMVSRDYETEILKIIRAGIVNYMMKDSNYLSLLGTMIGQRNSSFLL